MSTEDPISPELVMKLNSLYGSSDFDELEGFLDPDVYWGAPDDHEQGCHNRQQVIDRWRHAKGAGVSAQVTEIEINGDKILIGIDVTGREGSAYTESRWQVLTVKESMIIEIIGFDNREEAMTRAMAPPQER